MLKHNFYAAKSMIKPLNLGYQKTNMCPNLCMLQCLEYTDLTNYRACGHAQYKPRTGREMTLVAHRKLRYFTIISGL